MAAVIPFHPIPHDTSVHDTLLHDIYSFFWGAATADTSSPNREHYSLKLFTAMQNANVKFMSNIGIDPEGN
eukprot:CAMPEP_0183774768 /NCGR_PEP_ID=MMETSP0739-20130205/42776_1 /TAXON_ID=385413 /ORGANISM="Thalassiosira miniscula, Strain CCMP1093" /LENGTH=70 /DNA_ID=CAMNT_0026016175 /DNA_START=397 /DNA_END=606 /DNA_ORIENTATION=+